MSSRAARKLLKAKLEPKEEEIEEEEEEEEEEVQPVKNAFDLLMEGEEGLDESNVEEEEVEEEEEKITKKTNSSSNSKNKNKKNKKKSRKAKKEEDEEKILKKFADLNTIESNSEGKNEEVDEDSLLLESQSEYLDPDNELIKLFGKQTIKEALKEKKGSKRVAHKRTKLIKPKESWPQVPEGLSMEFIGSEGGHSYFKVNWDETYKKVQEQFYLCVQSFDPNSFQALLQVYPYHVDSLLQLSSFCNQTGQFEMAMDLMERALFAFESSWHAMFNPLRGNCRLPYDIEENKPFYLAIFKFITMLGREGTSRSALEYCKLLLSLDMGDPLFILFIMDYYAVRSGQYQYVLEMYASSKMDEKRLSTLPNWNYSLALAKFKMEQQDTQPKKEEKKGAVKETAQKKSTQALMAQSSDDLLQHALMMFPMVLSPLAKKGGFQLTRIDTVSRATDDMTQHAFFVDFPVNPKNLQQIVTLFVERNFTLWKDPDVVKWLKKNVEAVITRIQKGDVMVTNFSTILQEEFVNTERDLFNHLLLSEYTDNLAANQLPPDVAQALRGGGQVEIYQGFHEAQAIRAANAPRIHATTNNPLALFLQTLIPWNETPNAPPL
eukprot:TRINITY_DN3505_c1_g1_i1.p1 TRINITY_DN3505_c1_g1~~TRINITY_DN3505_c1_g1_i1.p1  ORF type:complete len:644 (-),score=253.48 TRINITY_DN3505_c1_g1_i1:445-2262(-)